MGVDHEAEERGRVRETQRLRLIARDGGLLIDADELVSSQRLEGGKEDEKGKKDKEKGKKEGDG